MSPRHLPEPAPLETGGRVELRLVPGAGTIYEARWFRGNAVFTGTAVVDEHGEADVRVETPGAPEWLVGWTSALLRVVARDQAASGTPWPRRLTRWRNRPEPRD